MADEARRRGARMLREGGYVHSDVAADKKLIEKAIHEHENHEHGGVHTKLKLKTGGKVKGGAPKHRPDYRARGGGVHGPTADQPDDAQGNDNARSARARGGRTKGPSKVIVNVNAAPEKQPVPIPVPGRPPMAGPPPGGAMPPGAGGPPMMPPGAAPGGMPPGAMAGRPPMPGPGAMPPPGVRARGGAMRDRAGRFTGGAV